MIEEQNFKLQNRGWTCVVAKSHKIGFPTTRELNIATPSDVRRSGFD